MNALAIAAEAPFVLSVARRWCRGAEADDLAQETLARAIACADLFHGGCLRAWLTVMARNLWLSRLRRARTEAAMLASWHALAPRPPSDAAYHRLRLAEVDRALGRLDALSRRLVLDVGCEAMSYEAAGRRHGLSQDAVRMRLHRARRALA